MLRTHLVRARSLALSAGFLISGASAGAADLKITVDSGQPAGGFAFSPVWLGVHDGTYRTFTPGSGASAAVRTVAELGDASGLAADFAGHGAQTIVGSAPFGPGSSASSMLNVADPTTDRYLSFASMVVPSNDFFFGNSDPLAFRLFDDAGQFVGPTTIQIFGAQVWDAGTEVNDADFGATFLVGVVATDHVAEGGVITAVFGGGSDPSAYLASILGRGTPYGYDISHLITPGDLIATITITAVPEPGSIAMLAIGAAAAGAFGLRRSRRA